VWRVALIEWYDKRHREDDPMTDQELVISTIRKAGRIIGE
jgi:hypothetical protein